MSLTEQEKRNLDKILQFASPNNKFVDAPTPRPDPHSNKIVTSVLQGGIMTTTVRLEPERKKLSFSEELDKVLSLGTA